jgi:hypothetical protein
MSEKIRMVLLLGVPMLFLSIQHLPSANQGFYWFNGASYYTLFYSVMLLYVDSVILFIKSTGKGRAAARFIIAVLLAAILGGANFVTALLTFIAGFIFIVYSHSKKRGRLPQAIVLQVIFLIGFSVSVLAPGNAVRQAKFSGMGVPLTLLFSLGQSGGDIFLWSLEAVPVFILLIPLLYRLAGRSTFGFRLPGVFLLLTLLLFASQNAPPYYAMGWGGEDRLRDIVYYSFTWLMPANIFYFLGWACKRRPERAEKWRVFKRRLGLRDGSRAVACCAVALFLIAALNPLALHYTSSWVSARSLLDGGARSYGQQMNARLAVYEDKSVLRVQLPVLTVKPEPVFYADITDNPETMNNLDIRNYYQKSSVAAGDGK